MKNGKPNHGSGKTHFNKIKAKGESWIAARQRAIKAGTWRFPSATVAQPSSEKVPEGAVAAITN